MITTAKLTQCVKQSSGAHRPFLVRSALWVLLVSVCAPCALVYAESELSASNEARAANEILPPAYFRSANFEIGNVVTISDYFYRFNVKSDFGNYSVNSLSLLQKRIHEIETMAIVSARLEKRGYTFDRSPGGRHGVGSESVADLFANPVDTAGKLMDNFRYNFEETFIEKTESDEDEVIPDTETSTIDPGPHKRSAAAQINVDVYTPNPQLQELLDRLEEARSAGRLRDSVASVEQIRINIPVFGTGVFDARLRSSLKNHSASEVNAAVDETLKQLGVAKSTRVQFLIHRIYTPRSRLYFTEYLKLFRRVEGLDALVRRALNATQESDVLAFVNLARMLAFYHLSHGKLQSVASKTGFPVLLTRGQTLVFALPVDYLPWNEDTAGIAANLERLRAERGARNIELLVAGSADEPAMLEFADREIQVFNRYSF